MKKIFLTALVGLAGFTAFTTAGATPVTWVTGDVILGFENSAGTKDLLVDLGSGSSFAAAVAAKNFSPVNLNADLSTVFGNDWATNSATGVQYGIFGLPANKSIVYASVASGNSAPVKKVANALSTTLSHDNGLGLGYNTDVASSQGLTIGVEQFVGQNSDTGFSTWTGNTPSSTPFASYNVSFENGVAGELDLYGTTGTISTLEGQLMLSNAGLFSVVAVPEPSSYALCALGAILILLAVRRREGSRKNQTFTSSVESDRQPSVH